MSEILDFYAKCAIIYKPTTERSVMKKFFFGDQRSTLFTLCIVLGALMAIGLPLWQQVPFAEVPWHIGYWTMLPIVGTFGLIQQHSRRKR